MIETKTKKFEYTIFTCVLFLVVFGLIVLYSASSVFSNKQYGSSVYLFLRQAIFCISGIVLAIVVSFVPYKMYIKFSNYLFIGILILVIVTTFAGRISKGASRWREVKGLIFQTSELMKLALILYLAKVLTDTYDKLEKKDNFIRVMMIAYIPTLVVALNNLSTGIILFMISTMMVFIVSKKYLIFIFIITLIVLFYIFAYPMSKILNNVGLLKEYQVSRIFAWKDPENFPDAAYQTIQSLYALGSGRISGRGYLDSMQKNLIPEAHNDMIFAVLCEELGIIGAAIFFVLYVLLLFRIFYISFNLKDMTAMLITFGIGIHIATQIIFNVGVVTNLLPNTGVTLPFVSYGGSSLIVMFIEVGIVMSISKMLVNNE